MRYIGFINPRKLRLTESNEVKNKVGKIIIDPSSGSGNYLFTYDHVFDNHNKADEWYQDLEDAFQVGEEYGVEAGSWIEIKDPKDGYHAKVGKEELLKAMEKYNEKYLK